MGREATLPTWPTVFDGILVHEGTPTHEGKVADLTGDGTTDVVGKSDAEDGHVDAWYNET